MSGSCLLLGDAFASIVVRILLRRISGIKLTTRRCLRISGSKPTTISGSRRARRGRVVGLGGHQEELRVGGCLRQGGGAEVKKANLYKWL